MDIITGIQLALAAWAAGIVAWAWIRTWIWEDAGDGLDFIAPIVILLVLVNLPTLAGQGQMIPSGF